MSGLRDVVIFKTKDQALAVSRRTAGPAGVTVAGPWSAEISRVVPAGASTPSIVADPSSTITTVNDPSAGAMTVGSDVWMWRVVK